MPPATARRILEAEVHSIKFLWDQAKQRGQERLIVDQIKAIPSCTTADLLGALSRGRHPVVKWAMHIRLSALQIPPVLRLPNSDGSPQDELIMFCADLQWVQSVAPDLTPAFRGWRRVMETPHTAEEWHDRLYEPFIFAYKRGLNFTAARGLALPDNLRQQTLTMPNNKHAAERRSLKGEALANFQQALLAYAKAHPDRSGTRGPAAIAQRRAGLYRVHRLTGLSATLTAAHWHRITGEKLTRQAVLKQLNAVDEATRWARNQEH